MTIHRSNGFILKHTTVWLKNSEWERLQYLSASSGKSPSKFIEDLLVGYIDENSEAPNFKREKTNEIGRIRPFAFTDKNFDRIKDFCQEKKFSMSKLIVYVITQK